MHNQKRCSLVLFGGFALAKMIKDSVAFWKGVEVIACFFLLILCLLKTYLENEVTIITLLLFSILVVNGQGFYTSGTESLRVGDCKGADSLLSIEF